VRWPGSETNWPVVLQNTSTSLAWDVSGVQEKVREWYRSCDRCWFCSRTRGIPAATRAEIEKIRNESQSGNCRGRNLRLPAPTLNPMKPKGASFQSHHEKFFVRSKSGRCMS
jgi:hypothetical protein